MSWLDWIGVVILTLLWITTLAVVILGIGEEWDR